MSKPILEIQITTPDEKSGKVNAVFDSGSFYTILREDKVPEGASVHRRTQPRIFRTAAKGTSLSASGELPIVLTIGGKEVDDVALISADLAQEMLVGAGTMQKWDISIVNRQGRTEVTVGRDMHDPNVTEVDYCGHIRPEELARAGLDGFLARPREEFERAVESVLKKNADLYRRLV